MKLRYGIAAALVAGILFCLPNQAEALRIAGPIEAREIPYEFVIAESDAVVVASVVSVKKPEQPAGAKPAVIRPGRGLMLNVPTEGKFKVESVIADPAKSELAGKEIDVMLGMTARQAPNVGDKIALAIKSGGDGKYYILPYANAYMTDIEKAKKEFEKVGDMEKWKWGKESNGVRAVALVRNVQPNVNGAGMVQVSLGLRNVGKESIYINLFPGDRCLNLRAWQDGTPITANLMNTAESMVYEGQSYLTEVKPGALVWVSQWGVSAEGTAFSVQSVEGKFAMRASYKSSRESNGGGTKFWQGEVIAGEITAEMPKAATPVRGGPVRGGTIQIQPFNN